MADTPQPILIETARMTLIQKKQIRELKAKIAHVLAQNGVDPDVGLTALINVLAWGVAHMLDTPEQRKHWIETLTATLPLYVEAYLARELRVDG